MEIFDENPDMTGKRVGAFELLREIGQGGMGAVYLARRADGEFRQTVAVKLIKRGMDTDLILKRFRRERQIIASLDHPNITYFLGGGSTEDGLPFFVMEYIDGTPLYRFCDEKRLDIKERLEIFRQICAAVGAAHEKKVIHRDLKPSNVLVKADGTPKLLDFGIAKVLDPDLDTTGIDPTATSMRMMTPEYASPEQVAGEDVTHRSDIYSLGVILYELLTGRRPLRLKRQVPHETARIIREDLPANPSVNLTAEDNLVQVTGRENKPPSSVFTARNTSLEELRRTLSGDLDKIVLKALRKNPFERYETAEALALDIRNFLENRPVSAETFYPAAKTAAGNKSIAILPLKIIGAESAKTTDDIFLGVGLADALVSRLSGVQRLVVRPTSSVLAFAEEDPLEAGRRIGVDYILDGTVRRVGERVRITVQLLKTSEQSTVWAEKFDERFTDVLELEDIISERVARVLLPQLTGEERRRLEKRGTNNTDAYQAYLRGRYFANQFTDEYLLKALEAYSEAVAIDPDYALPHVGIADFYVWSVIFGEISSREGFPKAREAIENALQIDDTLGEAYAILSFITLLYDWDWPETERLVKRSLELNPNYYFAHEAYSAVFATQGIVKEAREEIVRAEELDPLSPRAKLMTSWTSYQLRDFPKAVEKARQGNEMQKNFPQGLLHLGNVLVMNGQASEAVGILKNSIVNWKDSGMPRYMLCFALMADGREDEARAVLDELLAIAERRFVMPYFLAMAYTALGETDLAFEWFEKAVDQRNVWMIWFGTEPKLDALRRDPRYLRILERTNNPLCRRQTHPAGGADTSETKEKSIAVLPFKLIHPAGDGAAEDEYLSVGLADALTMRLSNIRRFLVRPTGSSLSAGGSDPFAAGRELGVDYIVDGNIRHFGESIRVAVQLLDVEKNSTVWGHRFDERYTDVLTLEDSISEQVTKSLLPKLSGEEERRLGRRGTNSPEAYEAYMRARYFWNRFTPEAFAKTLVALEEAVRHDPEYAKAYASIADFYNWAAIYGILPTNEAAPKVYAAAKRALEIDDSLSEAHAALGLYYSSLFEHERAEEFYRRAIGLTPNYALAHEWLAATLVGTGRFDEGIEEVKLSEQLDPFSLRAKTLTAWTLLQARRFDEGLAKGREIIGLDPSYPQGYLQTGNHLLALGRDAEAVENFEKAAGMMKDSPLPVYSYCFALVAAGQTAKARRLAENLAARAETSYVGPYFIAMSYLAVGETDLAFGYFEKACEEKSHWLLWFGTEPLLDSVRHDQRYFELFRRLNNPLIEKQLAERNNGEDEKKTIAFLPFKLIGGANPEDEFLGVGLADALTSRFSNIGEFIVRPTSSVLPFARQPVDPFTAGKNLAVGYVVEGHLRHIGERIRVTVQLLNVADVSTVWSFPFDEIYTDVLTIEDSVSERVARSLLPQLSDEEAMNLSRRGTDSVEAFEEFLKGRYQWNLMTEGSFERALAHYGEAVRLDPEYALAYAALAEVFIHTGIQCIVPFAECSQRALAAAEKALALDPTLAEAHTAYGFAVMNAGYDWQTGIISFRRAVRLNPNSTLAHFWLQTHCLEVGKFEEAQAEVKKVLELEPNSLFGWHCLAWVYFITRKFDESLNVHRQIIETTTAYPFANFSYSWVLRLAGKFDEAVGQARNLVAAAPDNPMYKTALAAALAARGDTSKAGKILAELEATAAGKYVSPYMLAIVFVELGDIESAFEYLEKAAEIHDTWILWIAVDPQFDALRPDERYENILRTIKHPLAGPGSESKVPDP
jgi:eukaryotic-like serine/threonine-protein kinase